MSNPLIFLDLFAGAGGLSEGFINAGFEPIAHVELDKAACNTLKTRMAYHWLKRNNNSSLYSMYTAGEISRKEFYSKIPNDILDSVINAEISGDSIFDIFSKIDSIVKDKSIDLLIGGPPCQAYSVIGRSCDKNKMQGDKRNYLYIHYAHFLKKYSPKYFVFENVIGLLSAKDKDNKLYLDKMLAAFSALDYTTEYKVLSSQNYGVPQNRKRVIIIGKKNGEVGFYPKISERDNLKTISELFSDLPKIKSGEGKVHSGPNINNGVVDSLASTGLVNGNITWHIARQHTEQDLEIYRIAVQLWNESNSRLDYNNLPERLKTHRHRTGFLDRFKVVAGNMSYSHTVIAHISKDGHYYIHPDINQNRSLTPREAARLQTFPDDYFFEGFSEKPSRTAAFKQIGNAVPVLMAKNIAITLKKHW